MKGTRGISLWLLAVYLVATAALSVATLTCECAVHAGGGIRPAARTVPTMFRNTTAP